MAAFALLAAAAIAAGAGQATSDEAPEAAAVGRAEAISSELPPLPARRVTFEKGRQPDYFSGTLLGVEPATPAPVTSPQSKVRLRFWARSFVSTVDISSLKSRTIDAEVDVDRITAPAYEALIREHLPPGVGFGDLCLVEARSGQDPVIERETPDARAAFLARNAQGLLDLVEHYMAAHPPEALELYVAARRSLEDLLRRVRQEPDATRRARILVDGMGDLSGIVTRRVLQAQAVASLVASLDALEPFVAEADRSRWVALRAYGNAFATKAEAEADAVDAIVPVLHGFIVWSNTAKPTPSAKRDPGHAAAARRFAGRVKLVGFTLSPSRNPIAVPGPPTPLPDELTPILSFGGIVPYGGMAGAPGAVLAMPGQRTVRSDRVTAESFVAALREALRFDATLGGDYVIVGEWREDGITLVEAIPDSAEARRRVIETLGTSILEEVVQRLGVAGATKHMVTATAAWKRLRELGSEAPRDMRAYHVRQVQEARYGLQSWLRLIWPAERAQIQGILDEYGPAEGKVGSELRAVLDEAEKVARNAAALSAALDRELMGPRERE